VGITALRAHQHADSTIDFRRNVSGWRVFLQIRDVGPPDLCQIRKCSSKPPTHGGATATAFSGETAVQDNSVGLNAPLRSA